MSDFSIPKKTFLLIPAGTYRATINSLEKTTGNFGEQIKLMFHVLTDGIEGLEYTEGSVDLLAWCSANYSEKSKLYRWARAALANEFDPAADFLASRLINKRVLVNVERYTKDGGDFNRIMDVIAAPHTKAKSVAAASLVPPSPTPPPPTEPPDNDIPW
ncbi:MAG: hypothetical protein C3F13_14085 [Anaerolineales bacterium]|nr:hypothetical protein [Anaerolineae bacterium]PWB51561.1 MAG: hypothetical protein C3F13_14085 [Anaerolineales bacterium]